MGRYNLLDEKWIAVIRESGGQTEFVSLKEVFAHAQEYYDLAGEMKTQDFAVLRVLLAVLQTVFSRFDSDGNPYEMMDIDKNTFQQKKPVSREDLNDEKDFLFETWLDLWKRGEFPEIVQDYLEKWRDHFNLFDEKYPFYQVTQEEFNCSTEKRGKGEIFGKNLNRTIAESESTRAIFSPINNCAKDQLNYDQLVRWLIAFQGYTGSSDKKKVNDINSSSSGWLYELGGIYLKGKNFFETMMLNCILSTEFDEEIDDEFIHIQIPAWENSPAENIHKHCNQLIDNRTTLYTNWSRIIVIEPNYKEKETFSCHVAKLPKVNGIDNFIEAMTCWNWNGKGANKDHFLPEKHHSEEAVWRNFSVLIGIGRKEGEHFRRPGIISWYHRVCKDKSMRDLANLQITICTVSMKDDNDPKSKCPTDEIIDELKMNTAVLLDTNHRGWIELINTIVNESKVRIDRTLGDFLEKLSIIRGFKDTHLEDQGKEELYQKIDQSFRDWLYGIKESDSMNEKALEWYSILERAIRERGDEICQQISQRDLKGIIIKEEKKSLNIATAYNAFVHQISVQFHQNA